MKRSIEVLGTIVEIDLPKNHASLFSSCFSELERIEKTYSRFLDSSQLSRINAQLHTWQEIPQECAILISSAQEFQHNTQGHFDITLKSELEQLGYDKEYSLRGKRPSLFHRIKRVLRKPLTLKGQQLFLRQQIDFGGLGKGFAIDQIRKLLEKKKVKQYYINAGGDIYCKGKQRVALEHPEHKKRVIGELTLDTQALACSAGNRRSWGDYHHLINPKTLLPQKSMKAVWVLADSAIEADAYATALFCAGFKKAQELLQQLPIEALLVSHTNTIYKTKHFPVKYYDS